MCVDVVDVDATEGLGDGVRAGVGGVMVGFGGRGVGVRLDEGEGEIRLCCRSRSFSTFSIWSE